MATDRPRAGRPASGSNTGRIVDTVRAAVGLLTRLPVGSTAAVHAPDASGTTGAAAFPIVGAAVGLVGLVPIVLLGTAQPTLAAILGLGAIAIVTGALHLDGLADTADALLAPDPIRAEAARRDPAIGAGGAVALILVLAVDVAALAAIAGSAEGEPPIVAGGALVMAASIARAIPVVAARAAPPRTDHGGFGAWFAERLTTVEAFLAAAAAVIVAATIVLVVGSSALAVGAIVGGLLGLLFAAVIAAARGRLDGDGMGASIELTTAATLVAVALSVA